MTDTDTAPAVSRLDRALAAIERTGNALPDPALLFVGLLAIVWALSWALSGIDFGVIDPRTGASLEVHNQLSATALTRFMTELVPTFSHFHPVGVVLVALLGIGVAEHTGFINAALRGLLAVTARRWLTPMLIAVGILSHTAADAGYVLVIPLGGVIFYAAGRHPLAGIAAAFAGVSGGFSANVVPSALDPMLAGLTEAGAQILDPSFSANPLNNYFFTGVSSVLIIALGWWLTDRVVEPRLQRTPLDGELGDLPTLTALDAVERRALRWALALMLTSVVLLGMSMLPADSAWRAADGGLTSAGAPLMQAIVGLIFLLFLLPGIAYGVAAGTVRSSRDIITGMSKTMSTMGYYLVIMFCIAQFVSAFSHSNLGVLLALQGAAALQALALPGAITIVGIILLTGVINLFVGSASAKWALLAPIFVPLLMQLGLSPDLTQAAYRIGDSSTNIITPLMPYFPLVVVYCQRYVKGTGIGTLTAMMLPYSVAFLLLWTILLMIWWAMGLPLGLQAAYTYAP